MKNIKGEVSKMASTMVKTETQGSIREGGWMPYAVEGGGGGGVGYKKYVAFISQTGVLAPTARVLENTLGVNVTFGYINPGIYEINFSENIITTGVFFGGVTNWAMIQSCSNEGGFITNALSIWAFYKAPNQIGFEAYDSTGTIGDDFIGDVLIEIRVYP